ncbi:glycosyltransferase family 4 protein [Spirosoma taeanense]|uniref:Glycosyltransferase family 4 protein n=1 Tax=Spirosoma taeanense TaxID=2735870 RepID=A0A6M5Y6N3_9BACT|nr:glycosyltransferase family 1 protein [Spirosoma taeanense]QJW88362.1 glycosyltransferase family 4 protein [Spirosoma taeanense]
MPRVFLDTERMANLTSGLGQLCLHLGRELVRQKPPGWEITFLVSREQVGIFGPLATYKVAAKWRRLWHPWKFDVWHCPYQGTRFLPGRSTPLIYTILDLNYLSLPEYSLQRRARQKKRYQQRINQAVAITTISAYVAQDIREQLAVPAHTPLQVIYCGVETPSKAPETPPSIRPDGPFLFFIGMLQPYKNVHTLLPILEAFPEYRLVLAGPDDRPYGQEIREQARQMGIADRLLMPGPIDESTKWWLYANCDAFMFPSLLEGFGLPVVEAMALGKPVFCSPLTSLPEVGGSDAFYFSSFEAADVVETFRRGMEAFRNDPAMPDRLRQQSQRFRWETVAADYWKLYQQVYSGEMSQLQQQASNAL